MKRTHPSVTALASATLLALVSCSPDALAPPRLVAAESAIVNGAPDEGHPAVGILDSSAGLCTASLVGSRTVLTAGHCVVPGEAHYFLVDGKAWSVRETQRHPLYSTKHLGNDVALVVLDQAPPVKPVGISTRAPVAGQALTLVGFGDTGSDSVDSGTKRVGSAVVASVGSTFFVIGDGSGNPSNLCHGDSGGPSLSVIDGVELQVGIHSAIEGSCGLKAFDMRVDVYADWLGQASRGDLALDGKPSPHADTAAPRVTIVAPADGAELWRLSAVEARIVDEGEVRRAWLVIDGVTVEEVRASAPAVRFPGRELEPGAHRVAVVGEDWAGHRGEAAVQITLRAPGLFAAPCETGDACESGLCILEADGGRCSELCDPAGAPCPDQAACRPATGGQHACAPRPVGTGAGCAVAPGASPRLVGLLLLTLGLGCLGWRHARRARSPFQSLTARGG
jgi:hypothetical protein